MLAKPGQEADDEAAGPPPKMEPSHENDQHARPSFAESAETASRIFHSRRRCRGCGFASRRTRLRSASVKWCRATCGKSTTRLAVPGQYAERGGRLEIRRSTGTRYYRHGADGFARLRRRSRLRPVQRSRSPRSLRNIISEQNAGTGILGTSMYHHGFATLAFAEAPARRRSKPVDQRRIQSSLDSSRGTGRSPAITSQKNPLGAWLLAG